MMTLCKSMRLRDFAKSEDGVAAFELALIAALLAVVFAGMIQVVNALHQNVELQQAARAGAEYAIKYPSDTAGIEEVVTSATGNSSDGLTITVTQFCECPDGTPVACTDTCASGISPNVFMKVALSQPASQMLSPSGTMPGVTLRAEATMRAK